MQLVDTHCHIHDSEFSKRYDKSADELIAEAKQAGVTKLICVGTSLQSSKEAVDFCSTRQNCYASLALHPHETADKTLLELEKEVAQLDTIAAGAADVVAIGETGLDYYYHESDEAKDRQRKLLTLHIELAQKYNLPLIFHVRDAFDDFFAIIDEYQDIRGVVHSFSAGPEELEGVISRGLYIGLNGIMTFSKQRSQLKAAEQAPIEKLLIETDAPFLTPEPFRGKICTPEHARVTAEFLSNLRGESLDELADSTTANAKQLFGV